MADDILEEYYGPPKPPTLESMGTHGATQFGPFGRLALDPRKLADYGSAALGVLNAPIEGARRILNRGPVQLSSSEGEGDNIGRDAFDASSPAMTGFVGAPPGAIGAGGARPRGPQPAGFSGPQPTVEVAAPQIIKPREGQTILKPYGYNEKLSGIYKDPRQMLSEVRVAPENGNMKELFGVTRRDLYDIGQQGTRRGDMRPEEFLNLPKNPKGAAAADAVMNPRNEQRILDILAEAEKNPGLLHGMGAWYIQDPMFWELEKMFGRAEAIKRYTQLNQSMSSFSPAAGVETEIPRGLAFHHLASQGRMEDFVKHGGAGKFNPKNKNPEHLEQVGIFDVPGHAYHSTAQAPSAVYAWDAGRQKGDVPKVSTYAASSGVPETRFQTEWPVADAHWSRVVGLHDARPTGAVHDATMPEMTKLGPWWDKKISGERGKHSVHDQGLIWGAGSAQTGVKTPIGMSKLEMISNHIKKRAAQRGVDPQEMKRRILSGEDYAFGGEVERPPNASQRDVGERTQNLKMNREMFQPELPPLMRRDIEASEDAARFMAGDREPRDFPMSTPEARWLYWQNRKPESLD